MSSRVTMTYLEAAVHVLKAAQRPLTTKEITERAIDTGLLTPLGKTPHATMSAALYKAVQREQGIVKLEMPGEIRARRGSVRWALADT
ncbi:MAG TPA: hypothetical protein DHU96_31945 [Actinobacteria bacterium]|nr:hypothetical protein [Actinomycetota bacterium]